MRTIRFVLTMLSLTAAMTSGSSVAFAKLTETPTLSGQAPGIQPTLALAKGTRIQNVSRERNELGVYEPILFRDPENGNCIRLTAITRY